MEAGDYHDPALLNLKEHSIRKATHSNAATASINDWKL
jgi:hypothetical protein